MSQATTTYSDTFTQQSFGGLMREFRASFGRMMAARRERARIVAELNTYSDRELRDLGISRLDFHAIANSSFRQ